MDIREFAGQNYLEHRINQILYHVAQIPRSIYYSHCRAIYNTEQENADVRTLASLGFQPVNPNDHIHPSIADRIREDGGDGSEVMEYFCDLISVCKFFAFRALPGGAIPAGVAMELQRAREMDMQIIELPNYSIRRYLGPDETRQYTAETS